MEGFLMSYLLPNARLERTSGGDAAGPDFRVTYHGTVSTLDLFTDAARAWVEDNVAFEPWQWLGKWRVAADPRCMDMARDALLEAGFAEG
jgi:hypothetical protein